MSCGSPHDVDCAEALRHLHEFIDGEIGSAEEHEIARHVETCRGCLAEYDVERLVKAIVARSCCDHAPNQLRARVLAELVSARITSDSVIAPMPACSTRVRISS